MYQFKANGGFGMMLQAANPKKLFSEAARNIKIKTVKGSSHTIDPELAAKYINTPGDADDFSKWIFTALMAFQSGTALKKSYSKIMQALADGSFPHDITMTRYANRSQKQIISLDPETLKWVNPKLNPPGFSQFKPV